MKTKIKFLTLTFALVLSLVHSVESRSIAISCDDPGESELRNFLENYSTDRGSLNRYYTIDISPKRFERMEKFYIDWRDKLEKIHFGNLSQPGRVDYLLFKNRLVYELRLLDQQKKKFAEMEHLIPFAGVIIDLHESRRKMEAIKPDVLATVLTDMNRQIVTLQTKLEQKLKAYGNNKKSLVKGTVANRVVNTINQLGEVLEDWHHYYYGYDPLFSWWVEEPFNTLDSTLQNYSAFVREKLVGLNEKDNDTIVGDPIGQEALSIELANEMIPYTPDELIAIANREFAWCDAEMLKASRELGFGDDWRKALEHVKTLHVEPGKQPDLIRDLALEAIQFLEDRDLVTIPPLAKETWRMRMMSPRRQRVNPFFTGGETISISFPTNTMQHDDKLMSMRGNNIHFARATVHHELIPGHHLQGFMTSRYNTHRRIFRTPFWGEGWALYWELLLWDLNFQKSPENRIGMLFWRMHRCARIIFSLSFHLEKMTAEECIEFLVNRVGHEPANASAEVRRSFAGNYSPLYQCAYMLGGLQFRALYEELVASGQKTSRELHDAILKENRIPVEMVRALLINQPLTQDFVSEWRFAGDKF
ncbi:DUF885 family protein [candidate division KSB1 bacterium]|nr:DUF885 family protein [candidate division KSB1 bacterium]